ncbi:MAG: HlyD family efflux transporter periplasmic adaptor subunit [Methyloglobulus sp.]|nr:HlyD family efflux transporter periplasmic adaptor subunit [Methyloglobulus sp.]
MNQPLFRPEVFAERQTQWLGTVLLAPRLSHRFFSLFAILATTGILCLVFFGEYTRKAHINGWLVPQQGLIRVFAPQPSVVKQVLVQEGSEIRKGVPLLALSTEQQSSARGETQAEIARQLATRHNSLIVERKTQHSLFDQQAKSLGDRLLAVKSEQTELEREIDLQRDRLELAERSTGRIYQLSERGFVSTQQLQQQEEARLDQELKLQALERNRTVIKRDRVTLEGEIKDLPLKSRTQIGEIDRNIAQLEQDLAEVEARRQVIVPAPQDGTVTAIQVEPGGNANVSSPLLSIIPAGTKLEAHLLSPSRGIGFLQPGQRVLLRYQAYPFQKFGQYAGAVDHVSRSALSPSELPPQLSGLTSLYGTNEPVYQITVSLASQTVTAYGKPITLQPGMQLEADVVIESRKIYEWILDPLYTLSGQWQK